MESIKDKVAIIGMGCTNFGERWDAGAEDLLVEAAYECYEDAGIDPGDIQAAWVGTVGSGLTGTTLAHPLKLDYVPVTRVENACATATDAFRNACYAVAAGACDIALVAGVEKLKDSGYTGLGGAQAPGSKVEINSPPPVIFALAAVRYAHHYGMGIEELKRGMARVSVKSHHNGTLSPKAHFRREVTIDQVINAPPICWPLGLFDCCAVSDGAACAIVTRPDLARSFRDDYVLVKALATTCGGKQAELLDDADYVHVEQQVRASRMAYEQAGIKDPFRQIDHAIVHDCFSITEMLIYEDLGWAPRGKAKEFVEAGVFDLDGELAVNTDGGLKCFGHPIGASGLRMIYEVYKQLQGKAGPRQRKNPTLGLTHNLGGTAFGALTCAISILGLKD